ncbi:MAG: lamin tail domain-containing protein [Actinomycetota bacterium]|nr:lamin tail domain-containing protein [Actinomycetota bacterium]
MKTLRRSVALALSVAAALGAVSTPASAAGPITSYGTVTHIGDGDTIDVDVEGDGTGTPIRVRLAGINTMELTRYANDPANWRGECHAVEAAKAVRALVLNKRVKLTAQDASSMSGSRYRRVVWRQVDGGWRDVSHELLDWGHGLFLSNGVEYDRNRAHAAAAQYAAYKGRGLWDRDYCGVGPNQAADLRVQVNWNADGNDATNVNGEWIKVENRSTYDVPLAGWRVRDSAARGYLQRGFVFPEAAKVKAGSAVYVHVGKGSNTATRFYWGLGAPIFENATEDPTYKGDGGYLFDPQGDARAWHMYPCRYRC